jgi:hypothetical protein
LPKRRDFLTQWVSKKLLSFFLILWMAQSPCVWASLSIQPANGGTVSGASTGGATFYYFVSTGQSSGAGSGAPLSPAFILGFTPLNLMTGFSADSQLSSALPNMFQVTVTSSNINYTVATGQQLVITMQASGSSNSTSSSSSTRFAPIAAVNGLACNSSICQGQGAYNNTSNGNGGSGSWFYAAKFIPNASNAMTIGFYPNDICSDSGTSSFPTGCVSSSPSSISPPTAGSVGSLTLTFSVMAAPDTVSIPQSTALDKTTSPIVFSFQVDSPVFNCPPSGVLSSDYTPGDGNIQFTGNGFSMSQTNSCSSCAPATTFFVVAQSSSIPNDPHAYPVVDPTFQTANPIVANIAPGVQPQRVGNFQNSTSAAPVYYQVSFLYQDQSGQYVSDGTNNGVPACLLAPVQTAAIQGYLGKSNCFIATATFASAESPPVRLLRRFRDTVLLDYSVGSAFVQWYYHWSPPAAQWLMDHPVFKLPVLLILAPLEVIAGLALHPWLLALLLGVFSISGLLILLYFFYDARRDFTVRTTSGENT